MAYLEKIANIEDFEFRASKGNSGAESGAPIRVDLSGLREKASYLIARHIDFWEVLPGNDMGGAKVLSTECCAFNPAT